jgi:hypothetical protein
MLGYLRFPVECEDLGMGMTLGELEELLKRVLQETTPEIRYAARQTPVVFRTHVQRVIITDVVVENKGLVFVLEPEF